MVWLLLALSAVAWGEPAEESASASGEASPIELGRLLYERGLLPSGESPRAVTAGGVSIDGVLLPCASCHRRSGFGSSEGGAWVPPVTAPNLFSARDPRRAELFRKLYQEVQPPRLVARARDPRLRPAYDAETLAVALREGRDPTGRLLDPTMPRYALSDEALTHLTAYLRTLGSTDDPGVGESQIHFATVVTPEVSPEECRAVLDVLRAYVRRKNLDTRGQLERPGHSLWHRDAFHPAYREWVLHAWELRGPPESWSEQLESFYREQPVFALLGGFGGAHWRPVHDFCERLTVPCLFPSTAWPVAAESGRYTLYFSQGAVLEARVLARYLSVRSEGPVVQVFRAGSPMREAAEAFGATWGESSESPRLSSWDLSQDSRPSEPLWRHLLLTEPPRTLVAWLEGSELRAFATTVAEMEEAPTLYFPSKALEELQSSGLDTRRLRFAYPYALPGQEPPRIYRARAWMRSRGLKLTHERSQLQAFFACTVADHALTHLVESFSRDYFIESVEHEVENALNPGLYPRLSLGPGQRFAAKGARVVRLSQDGAVESVSEWIVP